MYKRWTNQIHNPAWNYQNEHSLNSYQKWFRWQVSRSWWSKAGCVVCAIDWQPFTWTHQSMSFVALNHVISTCTCLQSWRICTLALLKCIDLKKMESTTNRLSGSDLYLHQTTKPSLYFLNLHTQWFQGSFVSGYKGSLIVKSEDNCQKYGPKPPSQNTAHKSTFENWICESSAWTARASRWLIQWNHYQTTSLTAL